MVEAIVFQSTQDSINVVQVPPLHIFVDTETTGLGHVSKYEIREDAVVEIGKWPSLEEAMHYFHIEREGDTPRAGSDAVAGLKVLEACLEEHNRKQRGL